MIMNTRATSLLITVLASVLTLTLVSCTVIAEPTATPIPPTSTPIPPTSTPEPSHEWSADQTLSVFREWAEDQYRSDGSNNKSCWNYLTNNGHDSIDLPIQSTERGKWTLRVEVFSPSGEIPVLVPKGSKSEIPVLVPKGSKSEVPVLGQKSESNQTEDYKYGIFNIYEDTQTVSMTDDSWDYMKKYCG